METRDLKYTLAYLTPISCWISLSMPGYYSFTTVIFLFVLIPIVEQFNHGNEVNFEPDQEKQKLSLRFFDWLLYVNLPVLYGLVAAYFILLAFAPLTTVEIVGNTLAIGIIIGGIGINVAHEIGHRPQWYNQWISRALLLPSLYMHFNIEHNKGHHKWVATPIDPATSRKGENFYAFLWRSVSQSFLSAWEIENKERERAGKTVLSLGNKMIQFMIIQTVYLLGVFFVFGGFALVMALVVAFIGFSLLEAVNHIEHYGLVRQKLPSGKYEPVQAHHSWNSNHSVGRILLYELTRHSDHHYKSTRKYQVLRHFDESPQLPLGYPASILMATIPPLWFREMDKRIPKALPKTA